MRAFLSDRTRRVDLVDSRLWAEPTLGAFQARLAVAEARRILEQNELGRYDEGTAEAFELAHGFDWYGKVTDEAYAALAASLEAFTGGETMTPKQAAKQKTLYDKLVAGLKVRESEYPAWQRNAGKIERYVDDRGEHELRAEYQRHMEAIHGADWQPNPAAVEWDAYRAVERGERCEICARPGPQTCEPCRDWHRGLLDRKRIRRVVAA